MIPFLVGGWTNPFEKYDRQNGFIFPEVGGKIKKLFETTTLILDEKFFKGYTPEI